MARRPTDLLIVNSSKLNSHLTLKICLDRFAKSESHYLIQLIIMTGPLYE